VTRKTWLPCFLVACLFLFCACASKAPAPEQKDQTPAATSDNSALSPVSTEELLASAKQMLRMDDFREFEKAEFRFLAVRLWRAQDAEIAGWLAQLYVAWVEQLKSEIDFLRLKVAASKVARQKDDFNALMALIDYRLMKLAEVEESARLLCNSMLTYFPEHYMSHRVMADYYRVMEDGEKAELKLATVEKLNPDSVGLLFITGALKMQVKQDYIGSIKYFDEALQKDPDFLKAQYFKGIAFHRMGRPDFAAQAMRKVLSQSPNHPGAKAYLAAEAYIKTLTEEAKEQLKVAQVQWANAPKKPKLVYWVGEWIDGHPAISYRIAAPSEAAGDAKILISLIHGETEQVLETTENSMPLTPNSFKSGNYNFKTIPGEGTPYILLQVQAKLQGEANFTTISIQKAPLPEKRQNVKGERAW